MKIIPILFLLTFGLLSCSQKSDSTTELKAKIAELQKQLNNSYKPGLGEFMSGIQVHHAKLYFAGINENWELADFEIHEIMESLEDIPKYCADREEVKDIHIINPAIDSVSEAIRLKDIILFKKTYSLLTNTCNDCHKATKHAFNVVKVPDTPIFSNQDFRKVLVK